MKTPIRPTRGTGFQLQRRTHIGLWAAGLFALWSTPSQGAVGLTTKTATPGELLVSARDWDTLEARRSADPDLDRLANTLLEKARQDLGLPLLERKLEGRRLLGVSREFIRRSLQWAFAYRVTGDVLFLERVRREMQAVAAFPDWNPSHFLDVAEMAAGLAIAYNWLYSALTQGERAQLRTALVDKALTLVRHGHKTFRAHNNWSQVCIGGMALAALAIQADEPVLAADVLAAAHRDVSIGLQAYAPDGVYPEGPGYWSYGTTYSVLLLAALRSAGVEGAEVLQAPGFARSAEFYTHSIGPSGKHFNFADGNEGQELPSPIVFLAREFGQDHWLQAKRAMVRRKQGLNERFAPLSALWWPTAGRAPDSTPTHFIGQGPQPVALWRTAWADPNALWFGIKGGGAAHNHGHMDAGGFVLDWMGLRWAKDLGPQDYNSLESRGIDLWNMRPGSPRWQVFRLGAEAHNTLTLDGRPHHPLAMATLQSTATDSATIDLSAVLGVRQAWRSVRFGGSGVELNDQLDGAAPGLPVRWALCTEADITLDAQGALLQQKGHSLRVAFSGESVQLQVLDISQPRQPFDHPNPRTRQLVATAPVQPDGRWHLQVRFIAATPSTPQAR